MASSGNICCKVSRVKINSQGYTFCGRYFGVGASVFRVRRWDDQTGNLYEWEYIRSADYQSARAHCKALGWKAVR